MRLWRRGRWVHPHTHEISKFMPSAPPRRGDVILVDGVRCKVVWSKVTWEGQRWTLHRLRVVEA